MEIISREMSQTASAFVIHPASPDSPKEAKLKKMRRKKKKTQGGHEREENWRKTLMRSRQGTE